MSVNNEKVSSFFGKLIILVILVAAYFGFAIMPHVMDYINIRQQAITIYKQKDLAVPEFTKERKAALIKQFSADLKKDFDLDIKPKEIEFITNSKTIEPHLAFSYIIHAKLLFIERYIDIPFEVRIEGNP